MPSTGVFATSPASSQVAELLAAILERTGHVLPALILGFVLLCLIYNDRMIGTSPRPKHIGQPPQTLPLLGHTAYLMRNRDNTLNRMIEWQLNLGGPTGDRPGTFTSVFGRMYMLNRPEYLEWIQKSNFGNYPKGWRFTTNFADLLGIHGIFAADGEVWRQQRKMASHIFSVQNFKSHVTSVVHKELDVTHALMDGIAAAQKEGGHNPTDAVNLCDIFFRFTLSSFGLMAFSAQLNCLPADPAMLDKPVPFAQAFDYAQGVVDLRFRNPFWKLEERLSSTGREMKAATTLINQYSYDIIDRRLAERRARSAEEKASMGKGDKDLLELFMDLTENREDLLPVVLNFIIAGRDTTAQALSWLFWLLSKHPECVELCRKEIEAVLRQGDGSVRKVNYEDMKNLTYVTACFNEALRLHPSVPKNAKEVLADDVIAPPGLPPVPVKKGEHVFWSDYVMARMPSIWGEDCAEFNPQRWIETPGPGAGGKGARPTLKNYGPWKAHFFNGGPRLCLGQTLATFEGLAVICALLASYDITPVQGSEEPVPSDSITHPIQNPYKVHVVKRA